MQIACHVENVYSFHALPSRSCQQAVSLDGSRLAKFSDDQEKPFVVTIIFVSIM